MQIPQFLYLQQLFPSNQMDHYILQAVHNKSMDVAKT